MRDFAKGCVALGLLLGPAWAARSAPLSLPDHLVSGGGGRSASARLAVSGSIGQPLASVGVAEGGGRVLRTGYWARLVKWINAAPVAAVDSVRRRPGEGVHVQVTWLLGNDTDPDFDPLVFAGFEGVSDLGGVVFREGPWLVYEPPTGLAPDAADTVTYYVSDGFAAPAAGLLQILPFTPPPGGAPNAIAIVVDPGPPARALVRFQAIAGRSYRVQVAEAIEGPWTDHAVATAGVDGRLVVEDPVVGATRYYRLVETP